MNRKFNWYYDFISPYAYLHFQLLQREFTDIEFEPTPVFFGGLLHNHQHKGPAEIPGKRLATYRYCTWLAGKHGIPFQFPEIHPFKPLGILRLATAIDASVDQLNTIFNTIWVEGNDVSDSDNLQTLSDKFGYSNVNSLISQDAVKVKLKSNTSTAIAQGVFGVPTLVRDGQLFWGVDMLPLAREFDANPELFTSSPYSRLDSIPDGLNPS